MDKTEAMAILRDVFTVCPEIGNAEFISLDIDNLSVNLKCYLLRIRLWVDLDGQSRTLIKPILDAHKVQMTQTKNLIIISSKPVSK